MGEHCTCCSPQKRDNLGQREPVPEGNGIWLYRGRVGEPGLALMRKSSGGVPTLCCQWMGEGDGGGKMLRVSRRCWHRAGINWEPCISWTLVFLCAPTVGSDAFPAPGRKPHKQLLLPQRQNHTDTHGEVLFFGSTTFYFINCHSKPRKYGLASPAFAPQCIPTCPL